MRTLLWFRGKDLRLSDHAPLRDALSGGDVVCLFVLDPFFFAPERAGQLPHRMQYLLDGLRELAAAIAARGSQLIVVKGRSVDVVPRVARRWRVDRVVAHRWVEPFGRERDRRIAAALDVPFELYEGETLLPPGTLRSGSDMPYSVFTPFARAFARRATIGRPLPAPKKIPPPPRDVRTRSAKIPSCQDLGIEPNPGLLVGGEREARRRLRRFLSGPAKRYHLDRDRLDLEGTSRLSADLKFGTLSVRAVYHAAKQQLRDDAAAEAFLTELIWREFSYSTLWDRPDLLEGAPFKPAFVGFPWEYNEQRWQAWTDGNTGYPVVDASARQLLSEGFVHNRARMISAAFLTKQLLIHYKHGEAHYMKYLTDGDWAQNNAGWQWSAGSGCDAQPYFRVFNPVAQGQRFDPEGSYVRRWVPELARVPTAYIHAPWQAPVEVLRAAGVQLGASYPAPIVDHPTARARYLRLAKQHLST